MPDFSGRWYWHCRETVLVKAVSSISLAQPYCGFCVTFLLLWLNTRFILAHSKGNTTRNSHLRSWGVWSLRLSRRLDWQLWQDNTYKSLLTRWGICVCRFCVGSWVGIGWWGCWWSKTVLFRRPNHHHVSPREALSGGTGLGSGTGTAVVVLVVPPVLVLVGPLVVKFVSTAAVFAASSAAVRTVGDGPIPPPVRI